MQKYLLGVVLLILAFAPLRTESKSLRSSQLVTQKAFFNNLKKMCGQRFEGRTDFPTNADHPMVGKKLLMSVGPCGPKELRIPFQVGEDKSRTWILTLGEKGLLFKHDHRHPDGTPDQITMYGGWAAANGTRYLQRFPADPDTVKLIPEAATNVWTLRIIPEKKQFMYYLERNNQPRYRAYFNLNNLHARVDRNYSSAVMAHHGWADFDRSKKVEVSGLIIESKYENPHASVKVRSDQGEWSVELSAVPRMRRHNITAEMIRNGTQVTLIGHPHKKRAREMKAIKMILDEKSFDLTS